MDLCANNDNCRPERFVCPCVCSTVLLFDHTLYGVDRQKHVLNSDKQLAPKDC